MEIYRLRAGKRKRLVAHWLKGNPTAKDAISLAVSLFPGERVEVVQAKRVLYRTPERDTDTKAGQLALFSFGYSKDDDNPTQAAKWT